MNLKLTENEIRVLGCLIEKSITTPDYYPMSINSITNACNQKSNRYPIMHLSEAEIQNTIGSLIKKYVVVARSGTSTRVLKYAHRFTDTVSNEFSFSPSEIAVLCVLFLRGAQTSGEIRSRTNRLFEFENVAQVEETIRGLMQREDGPYIIELPRQLGRRETRFRQLYSDPSKDLENYQPEINLDKSGQDQRLDSIENRLSQLEAIVNDLQGFLKEKTNS